MPGVTDATVAVGERLWHSKPVRHVILLCLLASACGAKTKTAAPASKSADDQEVVARIDGELITVGDVEQRIGGLDPYSRARFSSPEQKKKFLENLVRFEVLAKEAQNRGYDKDPDVQRVLKNQMITVLLQKELDEKLKAEPIGDAEVETYYREHQAEFRQPEQVRVSQILVKDKAAAEKVAAEARASSKSEKAFRDLVAKYSEDEDSKTREGDLTFFDRKNVTLPRPVVDAAFALKEIGDVSAPVQTDKGFHILKLTQRRPGFTRPVAEVSREIQRLIARDRRTKKMDEMVAQMRQKLKVQIYEDQLAKVVVPTPAGKTGSPPAALPGQVAPGGQP